MVNKCCNLLILMHVYSTMGSICGRQKNCCGTYKCIEEGIFVHGAYTNNVKSLYNNASGYIIDHIVFILGIYADIVVSHVHMK